MWRLFRERGDVLVLRSYAPGDSPHNPVERAMATLSFKMSGVILKHDKFGNHLNKDGKFGGMRGRFLNGYGDSVCANKSVGPLIDSRGQLRSLLAQCGHVVL